MKAFCPGLENRHGNEFKFKFFMTDSIADMLIRIKNAQAVKKESVLIPYSKMKMSIVSILSQKGFVKDIGRRGRKTRKYIEVALKYNDGEPAITEARRISKPSRRVYAPYSALRSFRQGFGIRILSTPKGVLSDSEARKLKAGGELICEVW